MPLISDWTKVSTSGPTLDGRFISEQTLKDIVETYDTESEYTALIWVDHRRWYGSYGKVVDVKVENDNKDRLCLFAKVQPNEHLLALNSQGQKRFASIEVNPDYKGTGKAYMDGLAVTDEPATNTGEFKFSRGDGEVTLLSDGLEMEPFRFSTVDKVKHFFSSNFESAEGKSMDMKAFSNAMNEFSSTVDKLGNAIDKLGESEEGNIGKKESDEEKFTKITDSFSVLNEKLESVNSELANLSQTLEKAISSEKEFTKIDEAPKDEEKKQYL